MKVIDINCDLGEGVGNEAVMMSLISSCNIACGGHAGDFDTMRSVVGLAGAHGVRIGAHPSFPDKKNFGRVIVSMSSGDLFDSLKSQIESLKSIVEAQQLKMNHVKPHGALYNLASVDVEVAATVVDVVKSVDSQLTLYVPFGSVISKIAIKQGLKVMYEAFADRNYNADLTLVSRSESDALIYDREAIFKHVYNMIFYGNVTTRHGVEVALKVDTICVHGDSENVIENLLYVRRKLFENNIGVS